MWIEHTRGLVNLTHIQVIIVQRDEDTSNFVVRAVARRQNKRDGVTLLSGTKTQCETFVADLMAQLSA